MAGDSDSCRILLVEDEADIREIVELSLGRDPRFEIVSFGSAEALLDHLQRKMDWFDAAILNVRLPGISGPELLKQLRRLPGTTHLRAIFLTASTLEPQVQHYEEQGALGVIGKPFDPIALPGQIKALLDD